jgi:hypothetical protein
MCTNIIDGRGTMTGTIICVLVNSNNGQGCDMPSFEGCNSVFLLAGVT